MENFCLGHIPYKWAKGGEGIRLPAWDGAEKMGSLWFNPAGPSLVITVISAAPFFLLSISPWGQLHCQLNPFPLLPPSVDTLQPGGPEASPHPSIHAKSSKATAVFPEGLSEWSSTGVAKCGPRKKNHLWCFCDVSGWKEVSGWNWKEVSERNIRGCFTVETAKQNPNLWRQA